jgi:hypothetical protein
MVLPVGIPTRLHKRLSSLGGAKDIRTMKPNLACTQSLFVSLLVACNPVQSADDAEDIDSLTRRNPTQTKGGTFE